MNDYIDHIANMEYGRPLKTVSSLLTSGSHFIRNKPIGKYMRYLDNTSLSFR